MIWIYHTDCPWNDVPAYMQYLSGLFTHYKNGFLLEEGGIGDQPNWYIEFMRLFENYSNHYETERSKEQTDAQNSYLRSQRNG